jgi:hypothetical protein
MDEPLWLEGFSMVFDEATKRASEDPPSIAELAERTRRSTPPPPSKPRGADVRSLFVPVERGSLIPTHVDNDVTPSLDLVSRRAPSQFVPYTASVIGLAILSSLAAVGALVGRSRAPAATTTSDERSMTPAQAASWAAAPFTVEVPLEAPSTHRATAHSVATSAPAFDLEAAAAAVAEAKATLDECDDVPAPASGVSITFSPTGRVTTVGRDSGELSECVKTRLSNVRIAPFSGQPVTVRTTLAPAL